jgi:two-component system CheB/CheR fusion protein
MMMNTEKLQQLLDDAHTTIHALQEELAATNRGLVALNMELDERVTQRTAELAQANQALRAEILERQRIEEERERLLAERKRQSKFLASLIDNAPIGVAVVDRNMRYVLANPAYQSIAGTPDTPVVGRTVAEVFPAEVARIVEPFVQQVFQSGELLRIPDYEAPIRGRTWWNVSEIPLLDAALNVEAVLILTEEVTERKQSEEELRQAVERYERQVRLFEGVASTTPDFVYLFDPQGRFVYANRRLLEVWGMTLPDVIGKTCRELGYEQWHHDMHMREIAQVIETKRPTKGEVPFRAPLTGVFGVYEYIFTPVIGPNGEVERVAGTTRDITDRKQAEEALKAAKDSAEQARAAADQANRAKDHFLAVLSHELRTPLTPVVMGVSMLQDRSDLAPTARETLEMIGRNVQMEARLIDDLLDVSRIARGKMELQKQRVELCTIIQRAVEVCKPDIEARSLHFGVDIGPAAPYWVEADVSRLQQVFWNLLKNAIKFTPHGGCVGIRCRPNEKHVVAEVNDSGIGMEPEALTRVFNAFEQAERSITRQFGGLGLGLAISKAMVEMHGGSISAHSEGRDQGATFRVRLPLVAPASRPETLAPAAAPQRAARPLRILQVEDHGVTAKMMRMVLTKEGHAVETAGDVATALELAGRQPFDLLLSDLGLPDGSGHDLMRGLRQRGHKFPGIAMSGYGQEEDIRRSYEAGFAAHLTKPASREALVEAIASVTAGK